MPHCWTVRVERVGERGCVRLPWTAAVHFQIEDIDRIEGLRRTQRMSGLGAHGWKGRWTVNTRMSPAARITFRAPARIRVLGLRMAVQVLDIAPATEASLMEALGINGDQEPTT